ncbi:MAG: hypothetical protein U0324_31770 [Polyangiales bacterium]
MKLRPFFPLVLLAACDPAPDAPDAQPSAATVDAFPERFLAAVCRALTDCPNPTGSALFVADPAATRRRCATALGPAYLHVLRRHIDAVRAGRARFDASEAERCYERVAAACSGDPELLLGRYCARVFEGMVTTGGACRLTAECAGEAYCRTTGTPCGTCQPRAALGASCMGGYDRCARPATGWSECVGEPLSQTCVEARSAPAAALGAPCGERRAADGALERIFCAPGGRCDAARGATGVCRAAVAAGAACGESDGCADGAQCVGGSCVARPLVTVAGGACGDPSGPRCDPLAALRCEAGRCAPVRDASGAPACDWQHPFNSCPAGQVCRRATSRCEAPAAEGAACNVDPECASGWCERSGSSGRCVRGTC